MFQNLDQGLSQDRYFEMQEQMGQPIEESKMPLAIQDFPDIVIIAINVFNRLGDRVYPEIGYIGKDYTNLPLYIEMYKIEDTDTFLEIILRLDSEAIKTAQDKLKREYDRMKRKTK